MRRKTILTRQDIKKRKAGRLSGALKSLWALGSFILRLAFVAVVLAGISAAFLFGYGYLLTSPHIRLETVEVLGVEENLKDELLDMAELNFEHSLLAVDLNEVKGRLEKHPWVKSVDVEKRFPHSLIIRAERQEVLALALDGGLHYMNRRGDLFKKVDPGEGIDYPVVTGLSDKEGERDAQIGAAIEVLCLLEVQAPPWDLDHLSEAHVTVDGMLHLYVSFMPGLIRVKAGDLTVKLEDLKKVVDHLASTGRIHMVKAIHLDYGEGAAVAFDKS